MNAGASDPWIYPQAHFIPSGDQPFAGSFHSGTSDDASRFPVTEPIPGSQYELNRAFRTPPDLPPGPVPNMPNASHGSTAGFFFHDTEQAYAGADASQAIGQDFSPFPDPRPPSHPLTLQPTENNVALAHTDVTYPIPISSTGHSGSPVHLNPPLENNIGSPISLHPGGHSISVPEGFLYYLMWLAEIAGYRLVPL